MAEQKHQWTYAENLYCVEVAFENFVVKKYTAMFNPVVEEIYRNFNGQIKRASVVMKLQNIKALLTEYHVDNTLTLRELENVSSDNRKAFLVVLERYQNLIDR